MLSKSDFDIIVIGAGPAGALAALLAARQGLSVLLAEKSSFPRYKVCGCCLNARALSILRECNLDHIHEEIQSQKLHSLELCSAENHISLPLPEARVVSRARLDLALVGCALHHGVQFISQCTARIIFCPRCETATDEVQVVLQSETTRTVTGKIVIVADGLAGNSLKGHSCMEAIAPADSWIGAGTISYKVPEFYAPGSIYMTYGHGGYLGLVRLEDNSIDIAAALDPKFVRSTGSIYQSAADLLDSSKWPHLYDLPSLQWKGTTALTKKRRAIAGHRVFVIGDAASYVEPFTGEGIAWALASAQAVAPLAVQAVRNWNPTYISLWEQMYNHKIQRQQLFGKLTRFALHRPMLASAMFSFINKAPALKHVLANTTHQVLEGKTQKCPLPSQV